MPGDQGRLDGEAVVDGVAGGQEAMGRTLTLEALLLPLPAPDHQVAVLGAVVLPQAFCPVPTRQAEPVKSCAVRCKPIRHNRLRTDALVLQQPTHQFQCRPGVAAPLHQHIEHLTLAVDGTPQPHPLAADLYGDFVQMPAIAWSEPPAAQIGGELWPKPDCPNPHCLIADFDALSGEQPLDIP
jgi:hypothetical protein